jgi:hypothetical protein
LDLDLADELEHFIEDDGLWDPAELERYATLLVGSLPASGLAADLAHAFTAVRLRLEMGPVSPRLRHDVEGVFYPRLWKLIEAVRDDLPVGEQLTRVQVFNRRLARLFVDEDPHSGS